MWITLRQPVGKDQAWGRFLTRSRVSTKLHEAIAVPFKDEREGETVGSEELTVAKVLPLDALGGLLPDGRKVAHRRVEHLDRTLACGVDQCGRLR
jgi:hypothetical protein